MLDAPNAPVAENIIVAEVKQRIRGDRTAAPRAARIAGLDNAPPALTQAPMLRVVDDSGHFGPLREGHFSSRGGEARAVG